MGRKEPIKGDENPINGREKQKEIKRVEKRKREMVVEARRWVGRGHATQIRQPPVPICGPSDPRTKGKGEPTVGKGKGRGRGWRLGKEARVSDLETDVFERVHNNNNTLLLVAVQKRKSKLSLIYFKPHDQHREVGFVKNLSF
jgi:hypothetical protein